MAVTVVIEWDKRMERQKIAGLRNSELERALGATILVLYFGFSCGFLFFGSVTGFGVFGFSIGLAF